MEPKKVSRASPKKRVVKKATIEFKKELIAKAEEGVRVSDLARMYGRSHSTISTILKEKDKIKAADVAKGVTTLTKQRNQVMEEMEKLLLIWINDQLKGDSMSEGIICEKARQLHSDLSKKEPGTSAVSAVEFKASRGWVDNFKKRIGIRKEKPSIKESGNQIKHEKYEENLIESNARFLADIKRTEPANTEDETRAQLPIEKGSSIKIEVMDGLEDFNEPKLEAECQSFEASESYLDIPKEAVDNLLSERLSGAVQVSDTGNLVNGKLKTTEFDLFAESIAFQLNNMPVSDALRLQFKIQQVITEFRLSNAPSTSSSPAILSFKKPRRSRKTKQSNSISRKKPSTSRSERMKRPLSSHVLSQEANICDLDIKTEYISDSLMCE